MPITITEDYRGHRIELTDNHFFQIVGPLFGGQNTTSDSYSQAREKIDKRIATHIKERKGMMSIPALNEEGDPVTVRGIHSETRRLLGVEKGDWVYPATGRVKTLLVERARLSRAANAINRQLNDLAIPVRRGWGKIEPEQYDALLTALTDEFTRKLGAAEKVAS